MRPDKSHVVIEVLPDDSVVLALIEPGHPKALLDMDLSCYTDKGVSVVATNGFGLIPEGVNPRDIRKVVIDFAESLR